MGQTDVQIELQELEGGVRASGLLCLLGVGIGLGSFFIYKLYTRLHLKSLPPSSLRRKSQYSSSSVDVLCRSPFRAPFPETPDSGISLTVDALPSSSSNLKTEFRDGILPRSALWKTSGSSDIRSTLHLPHLRRRRTHAAIFDWLVQSDLHKSTEDIDAEAECGYQSDIGDDVLKSFHSCRSSGFISAGRLTETGSVDVKLLNRRRSKYRSDSNLHRNFGLADVAIQSDDGLLSIKDFILVPSFDDPVENERQFVDDLDLNDDELWPEGETPGISNKEAQAKFYIASSDCEELHPKTSLERHCGSRRRRLSSGSSAFSCEFPRRELRRNCFSFASAHSGESSSYEYRESLVSKGFSVDLGEDLGDMVVPPESDFLEQGNRTRLNRIDHLHLELQKIRMDIDYMNEKVGILQSKDDLTKIADQYTLTETENELRRRLCRRRKSRSLNSLSRSCSRSVDQEFEVEEGDTLGTGDLIWDYHSDLALNQYNQPAFVADRPLIDAELEENEDFEFDETLISNGFNLTDTLKSSGFTTAGQRDNPGDIYFDDDIGTVGELGVARENGVDLLHRVSSEFSRDTFSCSPASCHSCLAENFSHVPKSCLCHHTEAKCCNSQVCSSHHFLNHRNENCRDSYRRPSCLCSAYPSSKCSTVCQAPACGMQCRHLPDSPGIRGFLCSGCLHRCSHNQQGSVLFSTPKGSGPCCRIPRVSGTEQSKNWSVGEKRDIYKHLEDVENHENSKMKHLKKGYAKIFGLWGTSKVRSMMSDCYSALRTVVYQALLTNLPILSSAGGDFTSCTRRLAGIIDAGHVYLLNWKFGKRTAASHNTVVFAMTDCLQTLCEQVKVVAGMPSIACREQYLVSLLNHSSETEAAILEAVKILMMMRAIQLYEDQTAGGTDLVFAWQLFARETSKTPELLFNNHINFVGDALQMHQMEFCLLGHALSVRIEVVRPHRSDEDDFVIHYPDEGADDFGKVCIIEDEAWRRYSVATL